MAVYSMTGYASASAGAHTDDEAAAASAAIVELRSVNARFLDLTFRLPDELRGVEPALRELLGSALRRGKVDVRVSTTAGAESIAPQPHPEQLNRLAQVESTVQGWLSKAAPLTVHEVLQWCRGTAPAEKLDSAALEAARRAVEALRDARAREGERLVAGLSERLARLRALAKDAAPLVPAAVQRQRERFLERWREALEATGAAQSVGAETLHERALNEAAAYALRIDVAEELSRLQAHVEEIERLLNAGGEVGKRLDFLMQELHREANTLGAKSPALDLTNISVEMKVLIEQMREQVQNLE